MAGQPPAVLGVESGNIACPAASKVIHGGFGSARGPRGLGTAARPGVRATLQSGPAGAAASRLGRLYRGLW